MIKSQRSITSSKSGKVLASVEVSLDLQASGHLEGDEDAVAGQGFGTELVDEVLDLEFIPALGGHLFFEEQLLLLHLHLFLASFAVLFFDHAAVVLFLLVADVAG